MLYTTIFFIPDIIIRFAGGPGKYFIADPQRRAIRSVFLNN